MWPTTSVLRHMLIFSGYETLEMTSESVNGAHESGVRAHTIQSLGVSILHSIILKRKHSGHACYHSHFPHHRGPELLISTLHWEPGKIVQCINIAHAGKLFHRPVLWLQTCTSDQHLIKHTQVCLKSNLEQISQDSRILWTRPRSIHTHALSMNSSRVAQVRLLGVFQWGNVSFMSFTVITFFHLRSPWKSLFSVCTCVMASVKQIGFETDHIRDMMIHSNAMRSLVKKKEKKERKVREKNDFLHLQVFFSSEDISSKPWFIEKDRFWSSLWALDIVQLRNLTIRFTLFAPGLLSI